MITRVNKGYMAQETWESNNPDLKKRVSKLRRYGYKIIVSKLGIQRTNYGLIRATSITILPGKNPDTCDLCHL